jgi:hypothetical protein
MPTLNIKTENARPALTQNLKDLYAAMHVGGTYDAKAQVITDGTHNELLDVFGTGEASKTVKGFKTKMQEWATEFIMAKDAPNEGKETTGLLTSVFGHHSTTRYSNGRIQD